MEDAFGSYHPAICFAFFVLAVVFGMVFQHPAFLMVSLACSTLYYLLLNGRKGVKFMLGMLALAVVLSFGNPLFNTYGDHVLFTYFGGRPYTLEALGYGVAIALTFVSVLVWFACYNVIMTSDKFTYLFGKFVPSISLIFTMVLRLVPNYRRQIAVIENARMCIGKAPSEGDRRNKLDSSITILSSLTSWALENAVVTGDSMRSRGYGTADRTSFAIYRATTRDKVVAAIMGIATVTVICTCAMGAMRAQYSPTFDIAPMEPLTVLALVMYAVLMAVPSAIHIWEEATWHILRSRI